jgi:hypothetical protein
MTSRSDGWWAGLSSPGAQDPRRFACQLATPWIIAIAVAFLAGADPVAWILAVPLLATGAVVTTTNWCLPSFVYGLLHGRPASITTA